MRRILMLLLLGVLVQGCATVTSGTSHSIAVMTDPAGAVCQIKRDGQVIAVVNPTPGTATISKSTKPLAIDCARAGGQPGATTVQPEFQAMTLGNVLLGGLIGLAVDAASGAMGTYPANVTIVLAPERFEGAAQRDTFYTARMDEVRGLFAERITVVRRNCTPGAPGSCENHVTVLEAERDAELKKLDDQRLAAPMRGT